MAPHRSRKYGCPKRLGVSHHNIHAKATDTVLITTFKRKNSPTFRHWVLYARQSFLGESLGTGHLDEADGNRQSVDEERQAMDPEIPERALAHLQFGIPFRSVPFE